MSALRPELAKYPSLTFQAFHSTPLVRDKTERPASKRQLREGGISYS